MKVISAILGLAFVIIAVCMFILIQRGVSLRTAPIIKHSILAEDEMNIATGVVLRLFPDFQQSDFVIWNLDQNSALVQKNLGIIKNRLEKELKKPISIIYDGLAASAEELKECVSPCWIYFKPDSVHKFDKNPFLTDIQKLSPHFITISWNEFERDMTFTDECLHEQRLSLECIKEASVNEVRRKLKEPGRYFFMRKYLDQDYFLFVEKAR